MTTRSRAGKKKPWRYRWPDDVRDEVLARLIELNAERAKAEQRSGAAADKGETCPPGEGRGRRASGGSLLMEPSPTRTTADSRRGARATGRDA